MSTKNSLAAISVRTELAEDCRSDGFSEAAGEKPSFAPASMMTTEVAAGSFGTSWADAAFLTPPAKR
jgi:hypothetical protein